MLIINKNNIQNSLIQNSELKFNRSKKNKTNIFPRLSFTLERVCVRVVDFILRNTYRVDFTFLFVFYLNKIKITKCLIYSLSMFLHVTFKRIERN